MTRPAPCDADVERLAAAPLPRTTKPGVAIEPGMTPSTPAPAGVAPLRWTITRGRRACSFQAKLWWFSTPASTLGAERACATLAVDHAWFAAA